MCCTVHITCVIDWINREYKMAGFFLRNAKIIGWKILGEEAAL